MSQARVDSDGDACAGEDRSGDLQTCVTNQRHGACCRIRADGGSPGSIRGTTEDDASKSQAVQALGECRPPLVEPVLLGPGGAWAERNERLVHVVPRQQLLGSCMVPGRRRKLHSGLVGVRGRQGAKQIPVFVPGQDPCGMRHGIMGQKGSAFARAKHPSTIGTREQAQ
jgi:hypothetical protein